MHRTLILLLGLFVSIALADPFGSPFGGPISSPIGDPTDEPHEEETAYFLGGYTTNVSGPLALQVRGAGMSDASQNHTASIHVHDADWVYYEFSANEVVWEGGRVTGAAGSRVVYATDASGNALSPPPYLKPSQALTNYVGNTRDHSAGTGYWTLFASAAALDAVGVDASANHASTLTDSNGGAYGASYKIITVPSNTLFTSVFAVKVDSDTSRYVGIGMEGIDGNYILYHLDTQNGTLVIQSGSGAANPRNNIVRVGNWWLVAVEETAASADTSVQVSHYPAVGTVQGTAAVAATGSAIFGYTALFAGKTIEQVLWEPLLINVSGSSSSIDASYPAFSGANLIDDHGLIHFDASTNANVGTLLTSGELVVSIDASSNVSVTDGTNTALKAITAGERTIDIVYGNDSSGNGIMQVAVDDSWGSETDYDGSINPGTITLEHDPIRNLQIWHLPKDAGKQKAGEL